MNRKVHIQEDYLYIPVCAGKQVERISFMIERENGCEKALEFMVPVDWNQKEAYAGDFCAEIPVKRYRGETMVIEGNAPENMLNSIVNAPKKEKTAERRPLIHFAPVQGWCNDPNGMVYKDGVYHLYFQYNPFDVAWNNMSWGHATSNDLLHWEQQDSVLFPDADGTAFSGCGLKNERGKLGLPEDALLFYYTVAGGTSEWSKGKEFTQKIAYSLDGGQTLQKVKQTCLDTLYFDNRDPKIFWHEESNAYIMVLWLRGYEFGIFRSLDLKFWEIQQEIFLEEGWECPDLFCLKNAEGEHKWFFWAADGHYYPGEFDGYQFKTTGERHRAYLTGLPYAAQTFSGVEGRTISIPWLRLPNDGRTFTGAYGIPVEFTYEVRHGWSYILQRPVQEFYEQLKEISQDQLLVEEDRVIYRPEKDQVLLDCQVEIDPFTKESYVCKINGSEVKYTPRTGELHVDGMGWRSRIECRKLEFIVDDRILEVFFDDGVAMGTFSLKESILTFALQTDKVKKYKLCKV